MGGNGSVYMQIKAAICEKWQPYSSLRSPPLFYAYILCKILFRRKLAEQEEDLD